MNCAAHGGPMKEWSAHYLTDDGLVLCWDCMSDPATHSALWPDCPNPNHDPFAHLRRATATLADLRRSARR